MGKAESKPTPKPVQQTTSTQDPRLAKVQRISKTITTLEQKIALKEKQSEQLTAKAKQKLAAGDKTGAGLLLKQRKQVQKQIENFHGQVLNFHNVKNALEQAMGNQDVVDAMRTANAGLQETKLDIDQVDDIMADIGEHIQDGQEIDNILSRDIMGGVAVEDDEDLLAELGAMEEEEALATSQSMPAVPSAPVGTPATSAATSQSSKAPVAAADDDLAALEAELA